MSTLKTKWGKSVAVVMALALTVASVPGADAQAAKKAKLSTKKLTIKVGKKKTIKIKNKVKKAKYTFKVKKASIAKVSKKGVVTAKKAGTTTITVKEKSGKKTRKLGTVKITVKKNTTTSKKTTPTTAPATVAPTASATAAPTAPSQGGASDPTKVPDPTQPADPTEVPGTPGPTKTPKPTPTVKPQPTPDAYVPEGKGWQKLDLSTWSGGDDNYLETGGQIVLSEVELETVPIPQNLEAKGDKIEVLVRGSVPEGSDGFRYWIANEAGGTLTTMGHYSNYGEGVEDPRLGEDPKSELDPTAFKAGQFQVQRVLEHINKDGVADDQLTGTRLLLKGPTYGTTLDGIIITGIWVRYGEDIGTDPGVDTPGIETPGTETPGTETSDGEKPTPTETPGVNKVDTDIELTKANSVVVGPLAVDGSADAQWGQDVADENEDGSITFYSSDAFSGGGRAFMFDPAKWSGYSKVVVTLSAKQADTPLVLIMQKDGKDVGKPTYTGTGKAGEEAKFEVPIESGANSVLVKYNGYKGNDQEDTRTVEEKQKVRADITVSSIKFVK